MKTLTLVHGLTSCGLAAALATPQHERPAAAVRGCQVSSDSSSRGAEGSATAADAIAAVAADIPSDMTVDVNFHIASTKADEALITDAIVEAQFDVLRAAYAPHGIALVLNSTSRVVDDLAGQAFLVNEGGDAGWVHHEEEHNAYLRHTRRGGYDALNLHFFSSYSPGATGYCQFPVASAGAGAVPAPGDDAFDYDACQMSAGTMPGMPANRAFEEWNLGHIAVHEAGHWFGLNHTFAGGCAEPGDFVDDTPAQLTQIFGCPADSDTCPDSPGKDPIHNYMGYTDDSWYGLPLSYSLSLYISLSSQRASLLSGTSCTNPSSTFSTNEFTPGQKTRMFETFFSFRRPS